MWALVLWIFALLLALVALCFILFCGYVFYMHEKYDHIPGPPRDSFIFGHIPTTLKLIKKNELMYDLFLEWVQKYGPVIRLNFLHRVLVLVVSPEAVKEFLMSPKYTKDRFYERLFNMFGVRFMGKGLVTDRDYDHWHKQRRIMDPAFSRTYLIGLMAPFNEKAEDLVEKLAEKANGKSEVGMHDMLCRVTLDVISKVAFGMDLNSIEDDQTPFPRAISLAMRGLVEMRNPFIRAIEEGDDIPVDILTQILKGEGKLKKISSQEGGCDMEGLLDNFVTFFIAGQETTANQLSFTVIELARNPDILKKAQDEVDEVLGSKRDLDYDDLGKLQYLSQVLKESLRMYPPAPGTSRALEEETVIGGVRIPAKTSLMVQMEAKVVMAKLLQRFEFELVEGQSFKIYDTGSLRPMGGAICRLRTRTISGTTNK
ncbi:PREDICTED: cholesterol 24-hydroxylase-like [Nanorana parkeri]|uniref:cholesterol 24-hydroxylase-like n=1 Tax=Nanorana parkeri TaxID=125878 RepID=UPI0008544A5A|nr:PREDICTED: cholesterol 24-hydroxylase-like [Nanorana parkeri]